MDKPFKHRRNLSRNTFEKKLKEKYKNEYEFHDEPDHEFYITGEKEKEILDIIMQKGIVLPKIDIEGYTFKGKDKKGRIFHIGSSMRFCIMTLKDYAPNIEFEYLGEKIIENIVTSKPHYDCHFLEEGKEYFIEAKCMELFDNNVFDNTKSKNKEEEDDLELSSSYVPVFYEKIAAPLGVFNSEEECREKWETLSYKDILPEESHKVFESKNSFDLKQFLCHLMGIIRAQEEQPKNKSRFCYLIYKNEDVAANAPEYGYFVQQIEEVAKRFKGILKSHNIEFGYLFHDDFKPLQNFNEMKILS